MRRRDVLTSVIITATALLACHCERAAKQAVPEPDPQPEVLPPAHKLIFPDDIRVEDESVNAFVNHAMEVAVAGVYEDFRLLWSAREEPLSRGEFERCWAAVTHIRVEAIKQARLGPDADKGRDKIMTVYAFLAHVEFDPEHPAFAADRNGTPLEPTREIVLMIIREHEAWRLAWAPKRMRDWLRETHKPMAPDTPDPPGPTSPDDGTKRAQPTPPAIHPKLEGKAP